jgi:hypothetical protein
MASYKMKSSVQIWDEQLVNYNAQLVTYSEQVAAIDADNKASEEQWQGYYDAWVVLHDAWLADPGDPPLPEPEAPIKPEPLQYPSEPIAPDPSMIVTYSSRIVEAPEELSTPAGIAIVLPGRIVLTGSDGASFALSEQELAYGYTEVTP